MLNIMCTCGATHYIQRIFLGQRCSLLQISFKMK
uniref:Uncharacterized protein n=1 Tax=Heterorhabditis bacteriophora TaxID=37862 RepID=A0A1I7W836_HETBA